MHRQQHKAVLEFYSKYKPNIKIIKNQPLANSIGPYDFIAKVTRVKISVATII